MSELTRDNVNAFLRRDWDRSRCSKDRAISRLARTRGAGATLALAQTLLDAVWPRINSSEARAEDLKAHLALKEKLRRASSVRR
ncbi:MAG: hypothetical protein AMXMBFR34_43090 [Myxococcaceae bacterium]